MDYPEWAYFPRNVAAPEWARSFVDVVRSARPLIESRRQEREGPDVIRPLKSNTVLAAMVDGLRALGYEVEDTVGRIERPILFGPQGRPTRTLNIDAYHEGLGIVVEVEAGRAAQSNAVERDLIRGWTIHDARFLVVVVPSLYRYRSSGRVMSSTVFQNSYDLLDSIYASQRFALPVEGHLLVGY